MPTARQPRNKHGTPVDPVPFLVVSLLGFTVVYSVGPVYLMELGVPLKPALALCTVVATVTALGAYQRYIWTARPDLRGEISATFRFRRLCYGVGVGIAIIALLSLPLVRP